MGERETFEGHEGAIENLYKEVEKKQGEEKSANAVLKAAERDLANAKKLLKANRAKLANFAGDEEKDSSRSRRRPSSKKRKGGGGGGERSGEAKCHPCQSARPGPGGARQRRRTG